MSGRRAPRTVGILGGMGPEATILLMSRVLALTPAADDADHVPLIVHSNTQVPSRIKALVEGTGEDPGPVLASMARRLEACGADALAMPCNTAHHYAGAIKAATNLPFLHMVALSAAAAAARVPRGGRIGILASPAVRTTALFEDPLARHGLRVSYPRDEASVLAAIRRIKVASSDPQARLSARDTVRELAAEGADAVLVACTELSIIAAELPQEVALVDTIDVLAGEIVRFATGPAATLEARPFEQA